MSGSSRSRKSRRSKGTKWFGVNPRIIIFGAIVLILIFLFVPMFSAAKVVEVSETIMVTVQKQVPETVTEDVPTKVYVGYLQEQGQTYGGNVPMMLLRVPGGCRATAAPIYNRALGLRYQIDVSDEIVDLQQANGPDGSLTVTLTNAAGKSTVYSYIDQYDLTKTGEIKIPTTVTKMNTVSEQEPQQVTKQQVVRIRVNLIQLLSANLREQAQ